MQIQPLVTRASRQGRPVDGAQLVLIQPSGRQTVVALSSESGHIAWHVPRALIGQNVRFVAREPGGGQVDLGVRRLVPGVGLPQVDFGAAAAQTGASRQAIAENARRNATMSSSHPCQSGGDCECGGRCGTMREGRPADLPVIDYAFGRAPILLRVLERFGIKRSALTQVSLRELVRGGLNPTFDRMLGNGKVLEWPSPSLGKGQECVEPSLPFLNLALVCNWSQGQFDSFALEAGRQFLSDALCGYEAKGLKPTLGDLLFLGILVQAYVEQWMEFWFDKCNEYFKANGGPDNPPWKPDKTYGVPGEGGGNGGGGDGQNGDGTPPPQCGPGEALVYEPVVNGSGNWTGNIKPSCKETPFGECKDNSFGICLDGQICVKCLGKGFACEDATNPCPAKGTCPLGCDKTKGCQVCMGDNGILTPKCHCDTTIEKVWQ